MFTSDPFGRNWLRNPSKKQVILVSVIWFVGFACNLLAYTNFFTELPTDNKYIIVHVLQLSATLITAVALFNYFRNRKARNMQQ